MHADAERLWTIFTNAFLLTRIFSNAYVFTYKNHNMILPVIWLRYRLYLICTWKSTLLWLDWWDDWRHSRRIWLWYSFFRHLQQNKRSSFSFFPLPLFFFLFLFHSLFFPFSSPLRSLFQSSNLYFPNRRDNRDVHFEILARTNFERQQQCGSATLH